MKKVFITILILCTPFLFLLLNVRFNPQRPNDINKKSGFSLPKTSFCEAKKFQTLFMDNTDYLVVDLNNIGKYGSDLIETTIGEGPKTFNPWDSKDATSSQISDLIFDSLVTTDTCTGEVIPKLAKRFDISADRCQYTFYLRRGVKWTDGKEVTAEDVLFTYKDIIFAGLGNTSVKDSLFIDGKLPEIKMIDKYTVKFITSKPFAPFLRTLSVPIAPKHIVLKYLDKNNPVESFSTIFASNFDTDKIVSNGAFILKEYMPSQRIVLSRNPNYYIIDQRGNNLPYIDNYIFQIVADKNSQILRFKSNQIDVLSLSGYYVSLFLENQTKNGFYDIYNLGPTTSTMFFCFNLNDRKDKDGKYYVDRNKQRWFRDRNFRSAIDFTIKRDDMILNIASGAAQSLFTAESLPSIFLNKKIAKGHNRDIKRAKILLKKSGFYWDKFGNLRDSEGNRVEFELLTNSGNTEREIIGIMIKSDLKELGIKVNFRPIEFNTLVSKLTSSLNWDTVIMGFTSNPLEPHSGINVWNSNGVLHIFNQRKSDEQNMNLLPFEKQLDNIYEKASLELDFGKRKRLYDRYQEIIYEEKPMIYLYSPLNIVAVRKRLRNLNPSSLGSVLHNPDQIYIEK